MSGELILAVYKQHIYAKYDIEKVMKSMPKRKRQFLQCLRMMARGEVQSFKVDLTDANNFWADIDWIFPKPPPNPFAKKDAVGEYDDLFELKSTLQFIDSVMRGEITSMSLDGYDDGRRRLFIAWRPA